MLNSLKLITNRFLILSLVTIGCVNQVTPAEVSSWEKKNPTWRGIHIMIQDNETMIVLENAIEKALIPLGVNALVLEINYNFEYQSHPELRTEKAVSKEQARSLAAVSQKHGIRVIPLFNCLGHQSWSETTFPLLTNYPEFDETPQIPQDNPGIYCRSWCPLHPKVNGVIFSMMAELLEAFQTDALHVGMDEVFLIGGEQCPRCKGKNPAELFAKAVNDYHNFLVGEHKATMLMWGDRLIDAKRMSYGEWEASANGTAPAIDMIPRDIVICDWHYEMRDDYPSVAFFQEKGFRVWPACWRRRVAAMALFYASQRNATDKMLGELCTVWGGSANVLRALMGAPVSDRGGRGSAQIADVITTVITRLQD